MSPTGVTRQLSSAWTPFYKFVFPSLSIGMFGSETVGLFVSSDKADARDLRWVFAAGLVAATAFLYWALMRLKRVVLENDTLVISNYLRETRVPLEDVERVSGSILMNPELVWLQFRHNTEFGQRVVFMLPTRFWRGFSDHPMVSELQQLVAQTSSSAVEQRETGDGPRFR